MAATMELSNIFDDPDISTLSSSIKNKLETYISKLKQSVEESNVKYEKLRVNSEQEFFEIEKRLISSNTKLQSESSSCNQLREQVSELEKKYEDASTKLRSVQETEEGSLSTQIRLTRTNEQLECEKRELTVLLEKRNREVDGLNDEHKELSRKLSEAITAKCEAQAKTDEIRSNEVNKEFQIKRLQEERAHLQKQIDWLNKDMDEKAQELMSVRMEKSGAVMEMGSKLEEKTEECTLLQSTLDAVKKTSTDQATKIDTLLQRIKEIQDSNTQSEEQFRQEIDARVRLVDLYKSSKDEGEDKISELTGAVTELQKLLKEAATAHTDMEKEKNDEIENITAEVASRDERIEGLQQELVNANELLSAMKTKGVSEQKIETMFPMAAATSKMLKSGMTLTEIYNEYVQATDSLQLEKEENKRLNTYLDQILEEIQEKAPMLKKQREDYDIALKSIDQMTRQLDTAMVDCQTMRAESDESHRKASHLKKENLKQLQQIRDLSDQVKYLVKEVEELKGGKVFPDEDVSSSEVSSSSRVISEKLVTFRNIGELQEKNQKLLAVIRELSDKKEQEESMAIDSRTRELKEQLELAQDELNHLKDARDRQAEMVESIVRQRDMYRVLLQQTGTTAGYSPGKPSSQGPSPQKGAQKVPQSPEDEKKYEESQKALKQLQAEFTSYRKEKLENDKIQTEQVDKSRQDLSNMRVENAKLLSELNFATERYKVLQGNAEGYRKEIATFRDKIQKYTTSVAKHEQTISMLKQELMSAQERVSQAQARLDNVKAEKDLVRSSEQRLSAELESIRRERHSQTMLMANLQAIQNNLERNEHETKHRLGKQVENLEREKMFLTKRLESEDRTHQAAIKLWEKQCHEQRHNLELEIKSHQKTKDMVGTTHKQLQDMKQQLVSVSGKLSSAEARLSNLTGEETGLARTNEQLKDLQSQLDQAAVENSSLQKQLDSAKQHVEQYKTIAESVQRTSNEETQSHSEFLENLEGKLKEATEERHHLNERLETLEQERLDLQNENLRVTQESQELNGDLRKQLTSLQNEMQEMVKRREMAINLETAARQECTEQMTVASEAQDKYERELLLHAADVETLTELKKRTEGFNDKLVEKEEKVRILEKTLAENKTSWQKREKLLLAERDKLSARVTDLLGQTRALHEQMGKLSTQVISVQERAVSSPRGKPGAAPDDDSVKSSEQLLEVVRYLRKEKDISEGKLDVVETECSRLKQRCETLEKQLEMVNTQLSEERSKLQADIQTAAQHAELMHKVESYNILHDSNKLLRDEKQQLQTQLIQAESKLGKLEEKLRPMQTELREIQAQKEALMVDKKSMQAETDRWKSRTNQLIEQSHKTDPEEHRRLVQEKEDMRKQMNSVTEDLHKAKAEATKMGIEVAKLQRQLGLTKDEQSSLSGQVTSLTAEVEEKTKDNAEKAKTIIQLRKIGRKYKEQAENITKEFDEYKGKQAGEEAKKQSAQQANSEQIQALEQKLKDAEKKSESLNSTVKEMETKKSQLETKVTELEGSKDMIERKLKESEVKRASMEQKVASLNNEREQFEQRTQSDDVESKKLREELTKAQKEHSDLKEEINRLKGATSKLEEENSELEKKVTRHNAVLQVARGKLGTLKEENAKLNSEKAELQKTSGQSSEETELRFSTMKSMLEEKIKRLEQDLQTKENSLVKENNELQNKVHQLQKQVDQKVSPQPQVQVSRPTGADRASASTSDPTKTANIRPIASSPASIKPQTVPVQPQSAASKVTASIRPMAITPTSVGMSATSGTPTATVMPTTVSQQDLSSDGESGPSSQQVFPQQQSLAGASRPTQQVQRVIPTQEVPSQESSHDSMSGTGIVESQPSSSRETPVIPVQQASKRQRDDESSEEDTSAKRSKTVAAEESTDIPEIVVTDEHAQTTAVAMPRSDLRQSDDEVEMEAETGDMREEPEYEYFMGAQTLEVGQDDQPGESGSDQEGEEGREEEGEEEGDSVIVVATSDEEDDDEGDEEEEEDEDEDNEGENYDEEDQFSEPRDDGVSEEVDIYEDIDEGDEGGFQSQSGDQAQGDDDEVVIIGDEEDDGQIESQESESQPSSQSLSQSLSQSSQQSLIPPLQPLITPERQLSTGSRNQLSQYMLGGHPYEDVDDCTVPSTPTLSVPRRGDGFAEAVSSPQVSQRFIFGSGGEQNLTLTGLSSLDAQAVLGMGMDDTRMDLSQLEEGSGRSVPSTPLHTTPPVTIITEVPDVVGSQSEPSLVISAGDGETTSVEAGNLSGDLGQDEADGDEDLHGELGEEDSHHEQEIGEATQEEVTERDVGEAEASGSQDDMPSSPTDRSQDAGKPKIQKIVWESQASSAAPTITSSPIPVLGQPRPSISSTSQTFRPTRGAPQQHRGGNVPTRVSRGSFHRGQTRRPMRGGRGGMYPRRPPMY